MTNIRLLAFALTLSTLSVTAQKLDLGKVTRSELLEKQHKNDTTAPAAIIFKKAKIVFNFSGTNGFVCRTVFKIKLKIYKKEGLKWANFKIPYYVGYKSLEQESVTILSGYTYNLEEDKIVKSKVAGEGKFEEKINENWGVKSVTFPNVKVGSIIELEYEFNSQNLSVLPDFQYQYDIPLDYAELETRIPEYYLYNAMKRGYVELNADQKMEFTSQAYDELVDHVKVGRVISYRQIVSDYKASNVPALIEEDYVNNINNYYGKLEHELKVIRYPDQEPKQIATTWEAVAKSIFEDKDFNVAISKFDYFANDIKSVINNVTSPEERTKKIFSYVKNRMSWNDYYGYYPKRKIEDAYAERVGNVGEINLMLVSMLRMAGIDANPVLISTRENGVALFPNLTIFNYVVVAAQIGNQTLLMDATDKLSEINMLPTRDLNWSGRLIKKDGTSTEIDLMPKTNSKTVVNLMGTITPQGEILGKIRQNYFDYYGYLFRRNYASLTNESNTERLEKKNQGLEVSAYDVQNKTDMTLPAIENYDFKTTNSVEIIGDRMYLSPMVLFATNTNPFKQEKREYPIDFVFPNQFRLNLNLTIPDGYVVETLPQSKSVAIPEKMGSFIYNISNNGKQLQLIYNQEINQAVIDAANYEALKTFYKEIVSKQSEKIVLKKV